VEFEKPVALKEWAVALKALREGKQILLMRKGGIIEETRDFQLKSRSFYLFPTYEHQKKELIKPEFQADMEATLEEENPSGSTVTISSRARVEADIEVFDSEQLLRLQPFHIWTEHFAEERLKWKKKNPLHILLLRVYNLKKPREIPVIPGYIGCKSWIELDDKQLEKEAFPVISDEEFEDRVNEITHVI
jgi:hypothetical protein